MFQSFENLLDSAIAPQESSWVSVSYYIHYFYFSTLLIQFACSEAQILPERSPWKQAFHQHSLYWLEPGAELGLQFVFCLFVLFLKHLYAISTFHCKLLFQWDTL